jgi:hypothetical protein
MSGYCRVNIHFCCNETNEIAKWDAKCGEERVEWTDTFSKVRSLACSSACMQKLEPAIQEGISLAISKGKTDPSCRMRMYVVPYDASGLSFLSLRPPLEIVDEDLSVSSIDFPSLCVLIQTKR